MEKLYYHYRSNNEVNKQDTLSSDPYGDLREDFNEKVFQRVVETLDKIKDAIRSQEKRMASDLSLHIIDSFSKYITEKISKLEMAENAKTIGYANISNLWDNSNRQINDIMFSYGQDLNLDVRFDINRAYSAIINYVHNLQRTKE